MTTAAARPRTRPPTDGLYRVEVKPISRSEGRSAVAAAAYRAGARLEDGRLGRTFDYTRKRGIVSTFIVAPPDAPAWVFDRAALWTAAEKAERHPRACVAREVVFTIPREIAPADRESFVRHMLRPYVRRGAVCDVAIHAPSAADGGEQPHAHILITERALTPTGFAKNKNDALLAMFQSGGRMGGEKGEAIVRERERWADGMNAYFRARGLIVRVDHRARIGTDLSEPRIGETAAARYRRDGRPSSNQRLAGAIRAARRAETQAFEQEVVMVKESMGISRVPYAQDRQAVKDRLLRERFPDLSISRAGIAHDSIYRVDVSKGDVTRVLMRDDSICEIKGGRVRLYGPDGDARRLGQAIAQAQGWDAADVVERLPERVRAAAPKGRYKRREDRAAEIERLCQYWQQAGFTDVTTSPKGVWVAIGNVRLLDSGDRIALHGAPTDDAINAMLDKAASEWGGRCEIYGDDDFKAKMFLAARLREPPVEISGYSPPDHVLAQLAALQKRQERQADQHQAAVAAVASVGDKAAEARALQSWLAGDTKAAPPPTIAAAVAAMSEAERRQLAAAPVFEVIPRLDGWRRQGEEMARAADARLDNMPPIPSEREFAAAAIAYAAGEREHAMLDRLTAYVDSLDPAERWAVGQMSVDEAMGHLDEWREIGKDLWAPPDLADDEPPPDFGDEPPPSEDDYGYSGPRL